MSENYHDVKIKELDELLKKEQKENELHSLIGRIINASDDLTLKYLIGK